MNLLKFQRLLWGKCVSNNSTYHSGHPAGSTASGAASGPSGSWVCERGERHWGVCSEAPGKHPVWADWSVLERNIN